MTQTIYKRLSERKIQILLDLCKFRVLTTEQLGERNADVTTMYLNKVLYQLRKAGLIRSSTQSGSRGQKKGHSFHAISMRGIGALHYNQHFVDESFADNYLTEQLRYYVLTANDLLVRAMENWQVHDSRATKKLFGLGSRTQVQGALISKDNQQSYAMYVMTEAPLTQTIGKIQSEIMERAGSIRQYVVFGKGKKGIEDFMHIAMSKTTTKDFLYTGYSIKVIPFKLGQQILKTFSSFEDWEQHSLYHFASVYGFKVIYSELEKGTTAEDLLNQSTAEHSVFKTIIEYQGKRYFYVNIMDLDIKKIQAIQTYSEADSRRHGMNLLVCTSMKLQEELVAVKRNFIEPIRVAPNEVLKVFHLKGEASDAAND
ncbi:hypothetical protein AAGS61_17440 [Lysinibacillus sp. KU-BSD001]|uniref:hypothetical protein n=1 Tax=Lysinibacillus sp. KU-BSD001 TaxID=3141328 RepID=UPI0036E1D5F9